MTERGELSGAPGNLRQHDGVDTYVPERLTDRSDFDWFIPDSEVDSAADALRSYITDPDTVVEPSWTEAIASCEIENVPRGRLSYDEYGVPDHPAVTACHEALTEADIRFDSSLTFKKSLKTVNEVLMQHREEEFPNGEFRTGLVKIESGGSVFVPPPPTHTTALLSDLYEFLSRNDGLSPVAKAAIGHYQFETIHPFTDGNGRTGRILLVQYLQQEYDSPVVPVSSVLSANRAQYFSLFSDVSMRGQWTEFIRFLADSIGASIAE